MSHKGARGPAIPRAAARGRWVRVGHCRTRHPPPPRFPAAAARRPAAPRPERGGDAGAPPLLCVPQPPLARPRGAGAPQLRCPSHAARGLSREQSAAARSRRHVPRPHPRAARPAGTWRRGRRSRRARAPSRAALAASGRPKTAPRRLRGRPGPAPPATAREVASPARGLSTRVNKAHTEWGWRPGRAAPSTRALRPPSRAQSLGARELPATPRRPPARRYLVGAPPLGPRPAPCAAAAAALFWRRFNSRPREKLSLPGDLAPRVRPEPRRGRRPRASLPRGAIVSAARPPARPARAGSARVPGAAAAHTPPPPTLPTAARPCPSASPRAREGAASRRCHTPGRPTAPRPAPVPSHAAAATLPRAIPPHPPAALRTRATHNRFHSLGGGAGRLTKRSSRHHLRLARRGLSLPPPHPPPLYYDPRPQAGGAARRPARPAEGLREGREPRRRGRGRPHPLGLARGREVARRRRSGGCGGTSKDHVGE